MRSEREGKTEAGKSRGRGGDDEGEETRDETPRGIRRQPADSTLGENWDGNPRIYQLPK